MKFFQKKGTNWVVAMAMLAIPSTLITSCSKDNNTEINQPKANGLTFAVSGIKVEQSGDIKTKGSVTTAKTSPKVYSFDDVDMVVSTDNTLPIKLTNAASIRRANSLAADVADENEAIESGAKYVVYIYNGTTFIKAKELTVGGNETIETADLDANTNYTWVALSYRDAVDAPGLTAADVVLPANKDVLRATGTLNLSQSQSVNILFDHVYSRIGIELNTIGVFGDINNTPAITIPKGLNLATGSLNLLSGVLTPSQSTTDISVLNFVDIDPAFKDRKIAYIYTAPVAQNQSFTVNVKNLDVKLVDGGGIRSYYTAAAGGNFTFTASSEAGKSYHIKLDVVESPLVTTLRNNVTVKWARSNLFDRNNGDALRGYAFYANNIQRSRADGYFSYKGLKAGQFPSTTTSGDPCALVYPAGTWQLPTQAQISSMTTGDAGLLSSVLSTVGTILGGIDEAQGSSVGTTGGNHAQYNIVSGGTTSTNAFGTSTSNSNNLRFFYNGQITDASVLAKIATDGSGLLGVGLSNLSVDLLGVQLVGTTIPILGTSYNSTAALWSGTDVVPGAVQGLLELGSYGYTANTTTANILGFPLGRNFVRAKTTAELLSNVGLLGITLVNTSFKNVRCVRAN